MLRIVALLLVVANLGYLAWRRGALAPFGWVPERFSQSEPQRLTQQVQPQWLQIRRVGVRPAAPTSTPTPGAGPDRGEGDLR